MDTPLCLDRELEAVLDDLERVRPAPRVLVIGDTPWDVFWLCRPAHGHQQHVFDRDETQCDVLRETSRPGTVFATASFLQEMGWRVTVLTLLGTDSTGDAILAAYTQALIDLIPIRLDGASLQRHYVVDCVEGLDRDEPRYRSIQRVNHEPSLDHVDFGDRYPSSGWKDELLESCSQADHIIINDTHKGTLSWCPHGSSIADAAATPVLDAVRLVTRKLGKSVTVLDVRKCLHLYRDIAVRFLASSAHEVTIALGQSPPAYDADVGGSRLDLHLAKQLLEEYPRIAEWVLTRGPNGLQHGRTVRSGWSMQLTEYPSMVPPALSTGFTPHCGDLFDAGLVLGLEALTATENAPVKVALYAAGLQALQGECRRLPASEFRASVGRVATLAKDWAAHSRQELDRSRYARAAQAVRSLGTQGELRLPDFLKEGLLPCWGDSPMDRTFRRALGALKSHRRSGALVLCTGAQGAGKTEFMEALARLVSDAPAADAVCRASGLELEDSAAIISALRRADDSGGILVVDELQPAHGHRLLELVNKARYGFRDVGLSGPVDAVVGGAAMTDDVLRAAPWRDVCLRATSKGLVTAVPGYDESIEDLPLWFALAYQWDEERSDTGAGVLRFDPAAMGELMLLRYNGTEDAWGNTQNWYMLAAIVRELIEEGVISGGVLDKGRFDEWLRGRKVVAAGFEANGRVVTIYLGKTP